MKRQPKGPRPKHIPQRTCIACRRADTKRGLMRVVRDQEARVVFDPTGKKAGRGAYLCHDPACWEMALKRRGLERALRVDTIAEDDLVALQHIVQTTLVADASAEDEKTRG